MNHDTYSREIPTITHVALKTRYLNNNRLLGYAYQTGIFVHLIGGQLEYNKITQAEFDTAKNNCKILLYDFGGQFLDRVKFIDDNEIHDSNSRQVMYMIRTAHEFLGLLIHYQIHFSNTNRPDS